MKRNFRLLRLPGLVTLGLVVAGLMIKLTHSKFDTGATQTAYDNPDKFYLWATNSSFSYSITYDPHAADDWMFESAGGLLNGSNPPGLGFSTNRTNPLNSR
jgi:hypothetical protein